MSKFLAGFVLLGVFLCAVNYSLAAADDDDEKPADGKEATLPDFTGACFQDVKKKWNLPGKWFKNIHYGDSGEPEIAPLSYACYELCSFQKLGLLDASGNPASGGFKKLKGKADPELLTKYEDAFNDCNSKIKRGQAPKVTIDSSGSEKPVKSYDKNDCSFALKLRICINLKINKDEVDDDDSAVKNSVAIDLKKHDEDVCFQDVNEKWEVGEWWGDDDIAYNKKGYVEKAPISYACYAQCFFKKLGVTNSAGVPYWQGYAKLAKAAPKGDARDNYARIRDTLKGCERDYKKGDVPKVTVDTKDGIQKGYKQEACIDSLKLTACVISRMGEE